MDIEQAKRLIRLKQLTKARNVLQGLDHPETHELLAEIERYLVLRPAVEATESGDFVYSISHFNNPDSRDDDDVDTDSSSTV